MCIRDRYSPLAAGHLARPQWKSESLRGTTDRVAMGKYDKTEAEDIDVYKRQILNILFWVLCRIYTKDSGFEVRLWDFVASTVLYICLLYTSMTVPERYESILSALKNGTPIRLNIIKLPEKNQGKN